MWPLLLLACKWPLLLAPRWPLLLLVCKWPLLLAPKWPLLRLACKWPLLLAPRWPLLLLACKWPLLLAPRWPLLLLAYKRPLLLAPKWPLLLLFPRWPLLLLACKWSSLLPACSWPPSTPPPEYWTQNRTVQPFVRGIFSYYVHNMKTFPLLMASGRSRAKPRLIPSLPLPLFPVICQKQPSHLTSSTFSSSPWPPSLDQDWVLTVSLPPWPGPCGL